MRHVAQDEQVRRYAGDLRDLLLERKHSVALLHLNLHLDRLLGAIVGHEDQLDEARGLHRQREREVHEGIERDRDALALGAAHLAAQQALKVVDDERVVAGAIVLPCLGGHDAIRAAVGGQRLGGRLGGDTVEILVQAVEQERQQFLSVVLLVAGKRRCETFELGLEFMRRQ